MRIYVTNLRAEVTDDDLRKLFETQGKVTATEIVKTPLTNEPTGLGIVEMESPSDASAARKELDGKLLKGSSIKIFDRRFIPNRREGRDRRVQDVPLDLANRRQKDRRQQSGEEVLVSLYDELDRRELEDRRISEQRNLDERRIRERRTGLEG